MGPVANPAIGIAQRDFRMMILTMGYPGNGIDECHRLVVILEAPGFFNGLASQGPAFKRAEKVITG